MAHRIRPSFLPHPSLIRPSTVEADAPVPARCRVPGLLFERHPAATSTTLVPLTHSLHIVLYYSSDCATYSYTQVHVTADRSHRSHKIHPTSQRAHLRELEVAARTRACARRAPRSRAPASQRRVPMNVINERDFTRDDANRVRRCTLNLHGVSIGHFFSFSY